MASTPALRAAIAALVLTIVLATAKVAVWVTTGSLAVLSQALDSVLDIVALALVAVAVSVSAKPADTEHQYGHAKAENLAAFTQTLILGAVVVAVIVESVGRLAGDDRAVGTPWYAFALLALSAIVDVYRVRLLIGAARAARSDSLRVGALNFITDIGTAVVAFVSLALSRAGVEGADAFGGLVVAAAVLVAAVRVGKRSVDVLMDRAPQSPRDEIVAAAARAPGVAEARRVRLRTSGRQLFADVTVGAGRTTSLERAHDIAESVEKEIDKVAPGADVVVHVEPVSETSGLVERVQAAASRIERVREVHNVHIHAFDDDGRRKLHVTLHAKMRAGTSLEEAHHLSDEIEAAVAAELQGEARVDTHIEPLEATMFARNVTGERADVVATVERAAAAEPDVVDCHEVLVMSSGPELSVTGHVRGTADLPLVRIHAASQRMENAIRAEHPEVGPVLIHFEPD
jgi:cation diffusion facilitator family transporter